MMKARPVKKNPKYNRKFCCYFTVGTADMIGMIG